MKNMFKNNIYLSVSLVVLNIIDAITTIIGLRYNCVEANQIMQPIVHHSVLLIAIKLLLPSLLIYRMYCGYKKSNDKLKHRIIVGLNIINLYYLIVVFINVTSTSYMLLYGKA